MASVLLASTDPALRTQLRRLLGTSARLAQQPLMEAGSRGEVEAALAGGTIDVAVIDEALLAGASLPITSRRTPIVLLTQFASEQVQRQGDRVTLRLPLGLQQLAAEVERLLPAPAANPADELAAAFRALQMDYLASLPERLTQLRESLRLGQAGDDSARENARKIFHQIRGTGASFGMPELSEAAARGETALVTLASTPSPALWAAAAAAANEMEALARQGVTGPA